MKKYVPDFLSPLMILFAVIFWMLNNPYAAIIMLAMRYFFFGFTETAFRLTHKKKYKVGSVFTSLTFPHLHNPFRKNLYYWTKAIQMFMDDKKDKAKALYYAKQVNADLIPMEKQKARYYSLLAGIYFEVDEKALGIDALHKVLKNDYSKWLRDFIRKLENGETDSDDIRKFKGMITS